MTFKLRFDLSAIPYWAGQYPIDSKEVKIVEEVAPAVRARGYYTQSEFLDVCAWKTPRTKPWCATNDEAFVRAVITVALSNTNDRLRIEVLTLLAGVAWPTASVLLHLGHAEPDPILDFRALWSLGVETLSAQYTFRFWWSYVQICREIAASAGVSMRTLDRALWQYSKAHQGVDRG